MGKATIIDDSAYADLYSAHVNTLTERHDRALERAGAGHAVIFSGAPHGVFLDDYNYPFKANPHFVSWLPLTNTPFCYLVYTPGEVPVLIYYQEKDYWHVPPATPEGYWPEEFDIRVIHSMEDATKHLPATRDNCILIGEITDEAQSFGIDRVNPGSAINMLHFDRSVKTGYELACMRAASRRAVKGHRAAEKAFKAGKTEFDIHLDYCRAAGHAENELPYGNIVALNENGAVLHYQHQSHEKPEEFRSFLIDAGARVNGYASDITRTYAKEDGEFADLVIRFDQLQLELVAEVKTGVDFADLHLLCHEKIAELLVETDLANGSPDALIESGVTSAFYPHGLGHLLGIQVHDIGGHMGDDTGTTVDPPSGHRFLRLTRSLEDDQVLTIEPGLYVIDMLLNNLSGTPGYDMINQKKIDWLRPYGGIRIEDNVRVQKDGCENLTRNAFEL
ncbi:MAG: Xaa-Pro dipeptidase [Proteobacteria bacterium]|nr:Xaa-Pro dipeptidase [Pseudomonadota bacterium]MDA0994091.1 Xaa-Pro dipeptidase [Pseudomonadota bacterium]